MTFDPHRTCEIIMPHSGSYERQLLRLKHSVTSITEHKDVTIQRVCDMLIAGFEKTLGIELVLGELSDAEKELKTFLMGHKYMTTKWNMEGGCKGWM
jgi:lipoate-protein ligase A